MMAVAGFHCSHEQHAPSALLRYAKRAAEAGFTAAMCSDHFHPWSERHGQSGFAWSWLGAALEGTPMSFGTVCAPGQRYHPAVIAQASATLAEMYAGRLWLALGSGEALNEAITGDPWPAKPDRQARLEESAETIRALWAGETVSMRMHTTTQGARLYSRPAQPPLLVGAALTPETARWVGSWADGLVTVASTPDRLRAVVDAFREDGGGKPMFLQVTLAYAPTEAEAERAACNEWAHAALGSDELADLASPAEFDRATARLRPEDVIARVPASADIERHIARLHELAALGFERLYLHNVARAHQDLFIDACGTTLLPALASRQEHTRA
jgi:probable non-F420 flavinoid oxidoreductase